MADTLVLLEPRSQSAKRKNHYLRRIIDLIIRKRKSYRIGKDTNRTYIGEGKPFRAFHDKQPASACML